MTLYTAIVTERGYRGPDNLFFMTHQDLAVVVDSLGKFIQDDVWEKESPDPAPVDPLDTILKFRVISEDIWVDVFRTSLSPTRGVSEPIDIETLPALLEAEYQALGAPTPRLYTVIWRNIEEDNPIITRSYTSPRKLLEDLEAAWVRVPDAFIFGSTLEEYFDNVEDERILIYVHPVGNPEGGLERVYLSNITQYAKEEEDKNARP